MDTDRDAAHQRSSEQHEKRIRIAKDDAFHILQNPRRRAVLRFLLEHGHDQYDMRDLAEAVAAWEHDTTVRELTSSQRQRVYIALYQSHLPKLDDYGIIEYDKQRGTIRPTRLLDVVAPFLDDGLHGADEYLTPSDDADDPTSRNKLASIGAILRRK